ncbi:DUF3558 family protein [Nocardia sp. NPDC088792]|uniref:DUF3558 family protein n=1 Tax=Nocardia sp. NPDC088792 TaxID=3364332 RepID=UPI0038158766
MSNRFRKATLILAAATSTALAASGCRTSATKSDDAPAWDPCTAFPGSALQELGLDYKAKTELHGHTCGWAKLGSGYNVEVTYRTMSRFADWTGPEDPSKVTVGSYDGHTYHVKGNSHPFMCALQLATKKANVVFTVTNTNYQDEDPCTFASRVANGLEKYLPPAQ